MSDPSGPGGSAGRRRGNALSIDPMIELAALGHTPPPTPGTPTSRVPAARQQIRASHVRVGFLDHARFTVPRSPPITGSPVRAVTPAITSSRQSAAMIAYHAAWQARRSTATVQARLSPQVADAKSVQEI